MTYVTQKSFAKILTLPITLPQTELRRGKSIRVLTWNLARGERMDLRSLTLTVLQILTPGNLPQYTNTALGASSIGLYFGETLTSPIAWASVGTVGSAATNPFARKRIITPGVYTVIVSNNTYNVDVSVCATGCVKLYGA